MNAVFFVQRRTTESLVFHSVYSSNSQMTASSLYMHTVW